MIELVRTLAEAKLDTSDLPSTPLAYACHPVAPRENERVWACVRCVRRTASVAELERCATCDLDMVRTGFDVVVWNVENARRWWRWFGLWDEIAVIMPWIINVEEWREKDAALIERGLRDDCNAVARCDAAIICNRLGNGSRREATAAYEADRLVFDLRHLGPFPPDGQIGSAATIHPRDVAWRAWTKGEP